MLRATFQNIVENRDVRKNLILLKEMLREDIKKGSHNREALLYVIAGRYEVFRGLLQDEDAKVRKNTALIMGELAVPEFAEILYEAYEEETQRFVKSSYLSALKNMDYNELLPKLRTSYEFVKSIPITDENKKHLGEELRLLEELLVFVRGEKKHTFVGYDVTNEMVLLCNRNHIHVTMEQLGKIPKKEFTAGVMVKTKELREVLKIRTYRELLFAVDGVRTVPNDVTKAAELLTDGSLYQFLQERHKGDSPYYFRLEMKGKMDVEKRTSFIKKLSMEIEHLSERKLLNSVNHYEVEIRLIENKEGKFNVLVRLYTLPEERFIYRKEVIASSIHPANAALTVQLVKPYLIEDAQVLDPFCGVGTMLIERDLCVRAKTMYGLDIYGEAIEKARINTELVNRCGMKKEDGGHLVINYINRDFFDFKHNYLFDEIITNMPTVGRSMDEGELFTLYQKFFKRAYELLEDQGIIVLYSHNREYVRKFANMKPYRIEKEFEISMMEKTYVYVIRVSKE